jgi:hypothetical protein
MYLFPAPHSTPVAGFRKRTRRPTVPEPRKLREVERILLAENQAALDWYAHCLKSSAADEVREARDRSVIAMRRLGRFLVTRQIPNDIARNHRNAAILSNELPTATYGSRLAGHLTSD